MKIALITPIEETTPPIKYGGIEWVVYYLAHFAGKEGHEVHLLTAGNSLKEDYYKIVPITKENIRSIKEIALNLKLREVVKFTSLFKAAKYLRENKFDIIHNHAGWRFLLFQELFNKKFLTTLHGPLHLDYQNYVFRKYKDSLYVSISDNQRKDLPILNFIATVYNGIDPNDFPFAPKPKDNYLLFFARFSPEKNPVEAIQAALETKKPIKIGAKIDKVDLDYFNKHKSLLENKLVEFAGEVGKKDKPDFYQNAKALISPINWEEPFGLMFIEAMASGTPVISYARGAAPEIIKDGETGFLINQTEKDKRGNWVIKETGKKGLIEAVKRIYNMPEEQYLQMRKNCREHFLKNFTAQKMVSNYLEIYKKIVNDTTR